MHSAVCCLVVFLAAALLPFDGPGEVLEREGFVAAPVDFRRDVRPILSDRCFVCHGPDGAQRQAGLRLDTREGATATLQSGRRAVVPGDVAASALVHRITAASSDDRMPPGESGKSLNSDEVDILRRWIAEGAPYAAHWSFVPPRRPTPPTVAAQERVRNPIDAFIFARLEHEGLAPSPEADAETLIRRVTLDLTGLPPTLPEIDAFLADESPRAYEHVVDRLLASPRYGEHLARFWLDAARYGDTHGFHLDNERTLWPWRDWVIEAFNANMPFDRFTVEQLAGDLLPDATRAQRIATGFNRCNPTTGEGGLIAEEYLAKYAMDRVDTTATVWLGLTVGCAQCHDHKFDPVSQKEYYGLFAFFNSIREEGSDRNALAPPPSLSAPTPEQETERAGLDERITALTAARDGPWPELDARQPAWERDWIERLDGSWTELEPLSALSHGGATLRVQDDLAVLASGASPDHDVYEIVARTELAGVVAIRLEALIDETHGNGVGRASHHNIVLSGFEVEAASASRPLEMKPVALDAATADYNQKGFAIGRALDGDSRTGWAIDGGTADRTAVFRLSAPLGHPAGTLLRFRLRFESGYVQHTIGKLRLSIATDPSVAPAILGPWSVVGPFPAASAERAWNDDFGPETGVDLAATFGDGKLAWTERPELVDGAVHMLPGGVSATYLHRRITAPGPRPMTLSFGSDDAVKIWLDGQEVFARDARRPVAADQDSVTVNLRAGPNELLMKVVNAGGAYGFYFRIRGEETAGLATSVARALRKPADARSESDRTTIRTHFREATSAEWRVARDAVGTAQKARSDLDARIPRSLIMQERETPRPAHLLVRGRYDLEGEVVPRGVPASLPPLDATAPTDRLALARWLVDPGHPLTSRVTVNRFWQQVFGAGLVLTAEDFGAQGEWPSHPRLLDWLATELVISGWNVKHLMRLMVCSATYRQASRSRPELLERDPSNRLLARAPRHRMDAEMIRDGALATSGLLVEKIGGRSVRPYQPEGIWKAVAYPSSNTAIFKADQGEALYRRGLYTFWKRTAPPPTMQIFDAPTRESCRVRRARTNTPLQALALLNDVQFVEAARAFAERTLQEGGATDDERLDFAFRSATARHPDAEELRILRGILEAQRDDFRAEPERAKLFIAVGASDPAAGTDPVRLAAWTTVTNLILNLDETLSRR